jgi:pyrroline-5-carboxylate reductase
MQQKIGFIGGGNMGEALIKGILKSGVCSRQAVYVSDIRSERLKTLQKSYGMKICKDNLATAAQADVLIVCVKPQNMEVVLAGLAPAISGRHLIISVAAGIPTDYISRHFKSSIPIIRVMPNTPALIGEGASALCKGRNATDSHLKIAQSVFSAVGKVVIVDESLMDAVTGLSGSGPAYVFLFVEALADAGVKMGLTREVALLLATQTCLGSAKMIAETGEHPARLRDMVTSPGGTTISGLHKLEAGRLRSTVMDAVEAATKRSQELGSARR